MKQIGKLAFFFILFSFLFCTCGNGTTDGGGTPDPKITVVTQAGVNRVEDILMAGTGGAVINWGDGNTYSFTLVPFDYGDFPKTGQEFDHTYAAAGKYTITITGSGLTHIDWNNNTLESVAFSDLKALEYVDFWNSGLASISVSGCPAIEYFECDYNNLTSIPFNSLKSVKELWIDDNLLSGSLNLSGFTALKVLACADNQLTSLNLTGCTALEGLYCGGNQLTSLNLTGYSKLRTLFCQNNQLTALNLSGCASIESIRCYYNELEAIDLNTLFGQLPDYKGTELDGIAYIYCFNPGYETGVYNASIATNKGWNVGDD